MYYRGALTLIAVPNFGEVILILGQPQLAFKTQKLFAMSLLKIACLVSRQLNLFRLVLLTVDWPIKKLWDDMRICQLPFFIAQAASHG
jgi:hypothetical protein